MQQKYLHTAAVLKLELKITDHCVFLGEMSLLHACHGIVKRLEETERLAGPKIR